MRALLTHTVLTLDKGMFGVEARVGIRLQNLDCREQHCELFAKALPGEAAALAAAL